MKCLIPLFMVVVTCYCVTLSDVLFAEWTEFKVTKNDLHVHMFNFNLKHAYIADSCVKNWKSVNKYMTL